MNVFYTILSYSLPNCDLQYICEVQIHNTPNTYAWQYSNELVSLVVVVFQLHSACHESVGKLLSYFLQLFSSVIEVFFRCYFRVTRRFMLRSQDELNTRVCQAWHVPWAPFRRGRKNCLAKIKIFIYRLLRARFFHRNLAFWSISRTFVAVLTVKNYNLCVRI